MSKKKKSKKKSIEATVVRSIDELKAIVGEEKAKEIVSALHKLADDGSDKVQCRVVIEFEAPDAVTGQAACAFLQSIVNGTIESAKWGKGSFQSVVSEPIEKGSKPEKPETKPVSPLN